MNNYCTSERNIQIVIALLKANNIKRVITSPGATDVSINASLQHDSFFELYSSVDERSAAYMACGMAAESGEPVVLTCTGATSARNYMPGLTEAYYRHLPVLAITCCRSNSNVGHYVDQVTDRSNPPSDVANISVYCQSIHCEDDEWDVTIKANKAILGLTWNGGGPCHINLATQYSLDFSVKDIRPVNVIRRYNSIDYLPEMPDGRIAIFVGCHEVWSKELTDAVDTFCAMYNAVVLCDQTSNYKGKYRVLFRLIADQYEAKMHDANFDLVIHIGYVSASVVKARKVWRVNPDGEIRDTFRRLAAVFQMEELDFFSYYAKKGFGKNDSLLSEYTNLYNNLKESIPELPFSNIWIAKQMAPMLPDNSILHLGILNSLRSWNYFEIPLSVSSFSNTGGFGIDGGVSSLIGASLIHKDKLFFGVFGDLLFFYDMNSIGNRHVGANLRILIINNGLGQEFKNYTSNGAVLGEETDLYIAACGHFGNHSRKVAKAYSESLGFRYLSADSKESFNESCKEFLSPKVTEGPLLFEIFTDTRDESEAYRLITTLSVKSRMLLKGVQMVSSKELNGVRSGIQKIFKKK